MIELIPIPPREVFVTLTGRGIRRLGEGITKLLSNISSCARWALGRCKHASHQTTISDVLVPQLGTVSRSGEKKYSPTEVYYPKAPLAIKAAQQLKDLSAEELDRDWKLAEFFGHIKIIGSKDSSRFPQLLKSMQEVGLAETQFELSPPIVGATLPESIWSRVPHWHGQDAKTKQKIAGCTMAQYRLIKNTQESYRAALQNYTRLQNQLQTHPLALEAAKKAIEKYSSVLIIEDNNAFGSIKNGVPTLEGMGRVVRETLAELPKNWDMFYFMALHGDYDLPQAQEVDGSPLLLKAAYGLTTKCFAVKATAYDQLVELYEAYIFPRLGSEVAYWTGSSLATMTVTPESISRVELRPADHIVALLHKKLNVYIAKEPLAYRFASVSLAGSASPGSGINLAEQHWQPRPH